MKIKMLDELFTPAVMVRYAEPCGLCRARACALGESAAGGYLGKSDQFDEAVDDFSVSYVEQCERVQGVFIKAVRAIPRRSRRGAGPSARACSDA